MWNKKRFHGQPTGLLVVLRLSYFSKRVQRDLGKIYSNLFLEFDLWLASWLRDDPFCISPLLLRYANMWCVLIVSSEIKLYLRQWWNVWFAQLELRELMEWCFVRIGFRSYGS